MECFGTTDFDNNSRLITLSAIIISGLHRIYLTAIGVTPGGSRTSHIYTQTVHIIQRKENWGVRAVPRLCELYPGICLTAEEKARKNLS
jgi:hypothetical protein